MSYQISKTNYIMLELTAACNARCPSCARTIHFIDQKKKIIGDTNINFDVVKKLFSNPWPNLKEINIDGNYGDSLFHPRSLEILEYIAQNLENPKNVKLFISTNGSFFDENFWKKLAIILSKFHEKTTVEFGIDGVDPETHARYRINTDLNLIFKNAQAFIAAGGRAEWKWIGFDWNDHQVQEAKVLSEKLGFQSFRYKNTRVRQSVLGNLIGSSGSEFHANSINSNISKEIIKDAVSEASSVKDFENESQILCKFRENDKGKYGFFVEHNGRIFQCCHIPGVYNYQTINSAKYKEYEYYMNKYDLHWNDLNYHSVSEILSHSYFSHDLEDSWKNKVDSEVNHRIKRCVVKCGSVRTGNIK